MEHKIVDRAEWLKSHAAFLEKEKELTKLRDAQARARRELPWTLVEKSYAFEGPTGTKTLSDLFDGKSQLIVQHFMLGPGSKEGCPGCSFMADHIDASLVHLRQRDVNFVAISRGDLKDLESFKKRMGWHFPWFSSGKSDFNYDFHVSFTEKDKAAGEVYYNYRKEPYSGEDSPGMSVFFKDAAGKIFHTYSTFGRGAEMVLGTYVLLDLLPKGRDEAPFKFHPMEWVRLHDKYDKPKSSDCCH